MTFGDRHSGQHRPSTHPHEVAGPERHHAHHAGAQITDEKAEALASKMVGGACIVSKTEAKFASNEVPAGIGAVAAGPDPEALANKIMKEAAREMEREAGIVTTGSDAALARAVVQHKDDPGAAEHAVAEKIRERIAAAESHADHHTFRSPNPERGSEPSNAKQRHLRGGVSKDYVTAGFRDERNPDVLPSRN